jgi:hypothetical protein
MNQVDAPCTDTETKLTAGKARINPTISLPLNIDQVLSIVVVHQIKRLLMTCTGN